MTTKAKWILTGVIVLVLLIGLVVGAGATRILQRVWGFNMGYTRLNTQVVPGMMGPGYGYGPMMGQGQFGPGMMGRGNFGRGQFGPGMMGRDGFGPGARRDDGFGPMMGRGFNGAGSTNSLLAVAADKLGLTTEQVTTELQAGKTIADLAKEKNVDVNTIVDAYVALHADQLAQQVKNGNLTQEQADAMQALQKANANALLQKKLSTQGPGFGPMWR